MDSKMKELIEKAKAATSVDEVQEMASEAGVQLSAEQAEKLYEQLSSGSELSDEDLDSISSGIFLADKNNANTRFI